jgi:hypothetical protein
MTSGKFGEIGELIFEIDLIAVFSAGILTLG